MLNRDLPAAELERLQSSCFERFVSQCCQVHIRALRQKLKEMKRPDPVTAVRRVGNPVNQVQNVGQGANGGLPSGAAGFEYRRFFVNADLQVLVNGLLQGAKPESVKKFR